MTDSSILRKFAGQRLVLALENPDFSPSRGMLLAALCRIALRKGCTTICFQPISISDDLLQLPDGAKIPRSLAVGCEGARRYPDGRINPILLQPLGDEKYLLYLKGVESGVITGADFCRRIDEFYPVAVAALERLLNSFKGVIMEYSILPGEAAKLGRAFDERLLAEVGGVSEHFDFPVNPAGFQESDFVLPHEYTAPKDPDALDAVVLNLPGSANFTEFDALDHENSVILRRVKSMTEIGKPDLILLPGSGCTSLNMQSLEEQNGRTILANLYSAGAWIAGICGGLQLLGQDIIDPDLIDSGNPECAMLNFLPISTFMKRPKIIRNCVAQRQVGGAVAGYEIHFGRTALLPGASGVSLQLDPEGNTVGFEMDRIYSSYLHGSFDNDDFRREWINRIRQSKGMKALSGAKSDYRVEKNMNKLADFAEAYIDVPEFLNLFRQRGLL